MRAGEGAAKPGNRHKRRKAGAGQSRGTEGQHRDRLAGGHHLGSEGKGGLRTLARASLAPTWDA